MPAGLYPMPVPDDRGSWLPRRLLLLLGADDMLPGLNAALDFGMGCDAWKLPERGCEGWKVPEAARPDGLKLDMLLMPEGMKLPEAVRSAGLKLLLGPELD